MRRWILAGLLAAGAAAPLAAADRSFAATGFDKVDLAAAARVDVHTGGSFAIRAAGDPSLLDRLDIAVREGTLVVGWRRGSSIQLNRNNNLHIAITMPRVAAATVSGAGTLSIDRAEAPDFAATLRGAGTLRLPSLHARQVRLDMNGAGQIVAAGSAEQIDAHLNGVGSIDAAQLAARAGRFAMSGTGSIQARVNGPADVTVAGIGRVEVRGQARCTIHKSGLGSVDCGA
jgi:hypothetical protein